MREELRQVMSDEMVQSTPAFDATASYFNGFQLALSNSDVNMTLLSQGQPKLVAIMSFTTAKTLHLALGNLVAALEHATSRDIMTMDEIAKGLETISPEQGQADG